MNMYDARLPEMGDIWSDSSGTYIWDGNEWVLYRPTTVPLHAATLEQILEEVSSRGYEIEVRKK